MTTYKTLSWERALAPAMKDGKQPQRIDDAFCYVAVGKISKEDGTILVTSFSSAIPENADNSNSRFDVPADQEVWRMQIIPGELEGEFILDDSTYVLV